MLLEIELVLISTWRQLLGPTKKFKRPGELRRHGVPLSTTESFSSWQAKKSNLSLAPTLNIDSLTKRRLGMSHPSSTSFFLCQQYT